MTKQFTKEEVDFICEKIRELLLPDKEVESKLPVNPFEAFPLYLRARDIRDATQYSNATVYELIHQLKVQVPNSVYRRNGRKGVHIHRDRFFEWFTSQNK